MDNATEMTIEQFHERFRPIQWPEGEWSCTYQQARGYPDNRVWTIIDADCSGDLYVGAGYHVVNRVGYVVTEAPWETEMEVAEWWIMDMDDDDEEGN